MASGGETSNCHAVANFKEDNVWTRMMVFISYLDSKEREHNQSL